MIVYDMFDGNNVCVNDGYLGFVRCFVECKEVEEYSEKVSYNVNGRF